MVNYLLSDKIYKRILKQISEQYPYEPITKLETMDYEICYNGYTDLIDETIQDNIYIVTELETNQYGTIFCSLYQVNTGDIIKLKVNKYSYNEHPCDVGDIIKTFINIQSKRRQIDGEWVKIKEQEEILKDYSIFKKFE